MLNLGDIVFQLRIKNNAWDKRRIEMVDADGNSWYRYDRDDYSYTITENTVIGKVTHVSEWIGEPREELPETAYYLDDDSEWNESDINRTDFIYVRLYTTRELAEADMAKHKEEYP